MKFNELGEKGQLALVNTHHIMSGSCPSPALISVKSRLNLVYHVYYGDRDRDI